MASKGHYRSKPPSYATCAWCGERKPIAEMRHPSSSRGKTPSTCHACRTSNPTLGWCDHHGTTHAIEEFPIDRHKPIGRLNICRDAVAYRAAEKRAKPHMTCPSCQQERESWYFRGGRHKAKCCRDCEDRNSGNRWCVDCADWLPETLFNRTGVDGRFWTVRCKPCRISNDHGVTRQHLEQITGSAEPRCGACGSADDLKIDHDHRHCPSHHGCVECVRGYLCHACNTAEGLLRTADRARLLADYMERWSVGTELSL